MCFFSAKIINLLLFPGNYNIINLRFGNAPIAQLDRALDYGSKGWGFDSLWAHQFITLREVAQFGSALRLGRRGRRFKSCLLDQLKK